MSALVALRAAIVADLEASIADAGTVEPYGGKLNLGEINRITRRTPAVLVAMVNGGASDERPENRLQVEMLISAFIVAEDKRGTDRDAVALSIAEQVMARVAAWPWRGTAQARQPNDAKIESLYSGELDRKGVALLAITWKQSLPIGTDRFEAERQAAELPDHAAPDGLTVAGASHGASDPENSDA